MRLRTRSKPLRLKYSGLLPMSMIKIQPYTDGIYRASKEVNKDICESSTLLKRNIQEIKGYVKKRKKHLSFVSIDVFKGMDKQVIVCYFADGGI